jgi:peptidyl-prolyl cis-trans isomerase SurA
VDKFSGYDRVEGGGRANAGVQATTQFDRGGSVTAVFGQSYQLFGLNSFAVQDVTNTAVDSGLQTPKSDYVASLAYSPNRTYTISTRARFDQDTGNIQRFEAEARANFDRWSVSVLYGDYAAQPDIGYLTRREGILVSGSVKLASNWVATGAARWDLWQTRLTNMLWAQATSTIASCWRPITSRRSPMRRRRRRRYLATPLCYSSACGPLPTPIRRRNRPGPGTLPGMNIRRGVAITGSANVAIMTMTTTVLSRLSALVLGCGAALIVTATWSPAYAQVAVMVNGEPITNFDVEQRSKLLMLSLKKMPERQQVIDELIDEKVKIREGKKFGIDPSTSDIDQSYAAMSSRMRITADQLTKSLESQGIRPDTLRSRVRAEMVWSNLIRGRYKESLQISEKDVQERVQELGGTETSTTQSFEYKMQPIVLVVPRGSAPEAVETRKKEAEALRGRIQTCAEANAFFKSMQNAAIRESVTKTSADIPAPLREVLDNTPIGHLTPPELTKQGVEMVALCSRDPTTVDTPKKREIRDKMFAEKFEAKSKSYLQEIRRAAMIEYR